MVVRDRLKEMQEASKYYKDGECDEIEMKPLNPKNKGPNVVDFFEVAEEIALGINEIKKNVDEIKICQKRVLTEPSKTERDKHQAKHNDLVDVNKSLARKVQKLIRDEQEKITKFESKGKFTSNELSELRLKKTQISTQSNRFLEVWTEYNMLQVEFRDKAKSALARNIKITNNNLTQEEIEEKLDKGDISVFSSAIIQETAAAKDQLVAIENRHAEILKLEAGIVEIHSMFVDLNNLVQMQGEMVSRIEDHVNNAEVDVEKGREDLGKAENFKKSANKKKFILAAILAVVVLIILLVILSEFGAFSSSGSTTTIVKHEYTYILPNGTKITSDTEQPNIPKSVEQSLDTVLLGTTPSTTVTVTSTTTTLPDYDGPGK
eukprot:TRINITY_DN12583_c0_g1_i1.p1 TRINITY_DN12583_c0_g1~~TRINITY_DN12583_c0_g1_i1.p1  ORF type:complete len:377 (-),score=128.12 TRINITY_DN12583_c0_g1_i1:481-1611(-)